MVALSPFLSQYGFRPRAVLHVGANNGAELEEYRRIGIRRGLMLEPVSTTFADLEQRIGAFPGFEASRQLVSDTDSTPVTIRVSSNAGESSSILALGTHSQHFPGIVVERSETLISTTLDTLLREREELDLYDLWVVDVEGAEMHVLRGSREALGAARIIMIEVHDEATHEGVPHWSDIEAFLAPFGFTLKALMITRYGFGDAIFAHESLVPRGSYIKEPHGLTNIAPGKPCEQSSRSVWSTDSEASAATTNTELDFAFHTEIEVAPWWAIDLQTEQPVELIRIFNREGARERALSLYVEVSRNGTEWTCVHENNGWYFGGTSTGPLAIRPDAGPFRYMRVGLRTKGYLHLQRVEVYVNNAVPA